MKSKNFLGFSFPNGMWLRSSTFSALVVEEKIVNGEVQEKVYYDGIYREFNALENYSKKSIAFIYVTSVLTHVVLYFMVFQFLGGTEYSWYVTAYLGLCMIIASNDISVLIIKIMVYTLFSEGRSARRYHGAEHKAVNAYKQIFEYPTFNQIKAASLYSDQCGTRTAIINPIVHVVRVITIIKLGDNTNFLLLILVVNIIAFVLSYIIFNSKVDMIFQKIFVGNPTELELKVAHKGMERLKKAEKTYFKDRYNV